MDRDKGQGQETRTRDKRLETMDKKQETVIEKEAKAEVETETVIEGED
mgnify:CR=1 FL=1